MKKEERDWYFKENNSWNIVLKIIISLILMTIWVNMVSSQPLNVERLGNLTIITEGATPIIKELKTPNGTYVNPSLTVGTNVSGIVTYNFLLRNIGEHKITYVDSEGLKTEKFYVTWKNNFLSLNFSWYWIALIGIIISLILIAFSFWKFAKFTLITTSIFMLSSDLSFLCTALAISMLIYAGWDSL